ncbi:MAG: DUF4270 domain-containing protein [Rikenellaceae bacterium]|nr:DUF4270 domain-containing protein [Rikenellaceae bacterium]
MWENTLNFMIVYSSRIIGKTFKSRCSLLLAGLVLLFLLPSCVTKNDSFGQGFLPDDQVMKMVVDSSFIIKTYNVESDSIESSNFTKVYLGHKTDSYTGEMYGEMICQISAPYFYYDYKFGTNATIDSAQIIFHISDSLGRSGVEQEFEIYEMTKAIHRDSTYFTNFDPTPFIESTPRFTFKNSINAEGYIIQDIDDQEFFKELLDTTGYSIDSLFRKRFKGWYVKPEQKVDGAIYEVDLNNSYLYVYYHNQNESPDTSQVLYRVAPTTSSNYELVPLAQSISMIKYDYTDADPSLKINDTINPVSKTFIQGFGGLSTVLEFTKESAEKIKADVKRAGFSHLIINKAKLEVSYTPNNYVEMERHLFNKLGMYTDLAEYENIPDYDYMSESYGYTLRYGGTVNRSRDMYEMDITMYAQRLFREDEYIHHRISLAPSVDEFNTMNFIELEGYGSGNPVRLIITYTMVK